MGRRRSRHELAETERRSYAYAACTAAEYAIVLARARREGLSVSDYVRRCINAVLLEEGDDVPLLAERRDPKPTVGSNGRAGRRA
jgi:hypothetical protein